MKNFPSIIDALFESMAREEGAFDKGEIPNRPQRNNNPLNLNFAHQDNATLERVPPGTNLKPRFAAWPTWGQGTAAAYRQIAAWIERGLSLHQVIETQAPANENNTQAYLSNMLKSVRLNFPELQEDEPLAKWFRAEV